MRAAVLVEFCVLLPPARLRWPGGLNSPLFSSGIQSGLHSLRVLGRLNDGSKIVSEENKSIVRRYIQEGLNQRNLQLFDEILATAFANHSPRDPRPSQHH